MMARGTGENIGRELNKIVSADNLTIPIEVARMRISGCKADLLIAKLGFENSFRVEAMGFVGGIWLLWNDDIIVDILKALSNSGFQGLIYTWSKGNLSQRLDRALGNDLWLSFTPNYYVRNLYRLKSNHWPIFVSASTAKGGESEKPFRFLVSWQTHPKFRNVVAKPWRFYRSTQQIKDWNKTVFGNIFSRKRRVLRKLDRAQERLERCCLERLKQKEMEIYLEIEQVLHQEELLWFQKSRCELLWNGD
ncbi:putative Transposon TX1 [Gossypium australe]|uniref:Putative Transposon TX1 n=1 Tax=Gossypium australe TaxID=47621 RepID=A0A5B6VXV7_9ROSI|nr:putative Transposon TX1 [Gossypium australe]